MSEYKIELLGEIDDLRKDITDLTTQLASARAEKKELLRRYRLRARMIRDHIADKKLLWTALEGMLSMYNTFWIGLPFNQCKTKTPTEIAEVIIEAEQALNPKKEKT